MTVEPFVIGSVWHEFEDKNQAALLSSGTLFNLADSLDDTWGEVSAGVNLFKTGTGVSGFGKVDVMFGDDIESVGGQLGVRFQLTGGALPFDGAGASHAPAETGSPSSDCCADLEQRVAELEATAVRRGNRKLEMTLAGTVSHAALTWDDGQNTDTYIVGNDNDGTSFEIAGEVERINNSDWSAGYLIEVGMLTAQSSEVNQINDNGPRGSGTLEINESHMWVRNKRLGQFSWGEVGGSSDVDDATEMDLSETRVVAFSSVEDVGGNFFLRRSDTKGVQGLTPVVWADLIDHLPGVDGPIVRYDSPITRGLGGWAEYGQGDVWEFVLAYNDPATLEEFEEIGEEDRPRTPQPSLIKGFQIAAAITYHGFNGQEDLPDNRNVAGSVSILHERTGLNLTVAGGERFFTERVELNDGRLGEPQDASFIYIKPGLLLNTFSAGHTAFYAEYGKWRDFLGRNADAEAVGGLAGFDEESVCAPGQACLVSQSEATIWGFGVVQRIESAEMDLFIGFRLYEAEVDLINEAGAKAPSAALNDFATVMSGALIEF